ncbi:hypothetical protein TNCV_2218501 [Trichonephila clavipes]|nr:hypothetical protein TNCV_2218501 [Trichonephila clavipes]
MIADQMKKRCSPECKEHYLDICEELISPELLADKLLKYPKVMAFYYETIHQNVLKVAVGSLVAGASDSRPEGLGLIPDATKYPPSTHGFNTLIVEVNIGGVAIYCPFENFSELNRTVTCMVIKAEAKDRRTPSPLPR